MENQAYVDNGWKVLFLLLGKFLLVMILGAIIIESEIEKSKNWLIIYMVMGGVQLVFAFAPDLYVKYFKKDLFLRIRIITWIIVLIIVVILNYLGNKTLSLIFLFNFLVLTFPSPDKYLPPRPKSS